VGGVGDRLGQHGHDLDVFHVMDRPDSDDPTGTTAIPDPTGYDAVVVTGSDWSVADPTAIDSWLPREVDAVRRAHAAGVPVLGLCFGGQVLATALGGTVERADEPEFGWIVVDTDRPDEVAPGPWFSWHVDRFSVPPGAEEVARTARAPQAFRAGRSVGLQFHPEVTPSIIRRWADEDGDVLSAHGLDPATVVRRSIDLDEANRRRADHLVDWFLADAGRTGPT